MFDLSTQPDLVVDFYCCDELYVQVTLYHCDKIASNPYAVLYYDTYTVFYFLYADFKILMFCY